MMRAQVLSRGPGRARSPEVVALVLLALALSACTAVKPYERGRLAHPSMTGNRTCGPGESHVHAVHEGAIGGAIGAEASCGCN